MILFSIFITTSISPLLDVIAATNIFLLSKLKDAVQFVVLLIITWYSPFDGVWGTACNKEVPL